MILLQVRSSWDFPLRANLHLNEAEQYGIISTQMKAQEPKPSTVVLKNILMWKASVERGEALSELSGKQLKQLDFWRQISNLALLSFSSDHPVCCCCTTRKHEKWKAPLPFL